VTTSSISPFFAKYIVLWTSFSLVSVLILVWDRKRLMPEWREYWRFLTARYGAVGGFATFTVPFPADG